MQTTVLLKLKDIYMKIIVLAFMLFNSGFTFAQTNVRVPSIWSFSISNLQGTYYRALLEEANKQQTKYNFIAESKPGAGGSIGAAYVGSHEKLALLGTAAGFFVRPYLYTSSAGYTFDQFVPIHLMTVTPAALVTGQDKELDAILKKKHISIGTAGTGSLTELMALKFKESHPGLDIKILPYKSSTEAMQDVLGGHIDLTFEFLGDAEAKKSKILGVTGRNKIKDYPLLKDIGYLSQADLTGVFFILVKQNTPVAIQAEIQLILIEAEKSSRVQELYKSDYSTKISSLKPHKDYQIWYAETIAKFKLLTTGLQVD